MSWLLAPLLWMGLDPLIAARIVMGVSSLLFWAGSWAMLKRVGLKPLSRAAASWCMTFAYAQWTAHYVTPDLLAAGLICFAVSALLASDWLVSWKRQCLVGGLWALAYYAKAVALPLGLATCLGIAYLAGIARACGLGSAHPNPRCELWP